jgi:hypothetical protein
MRVFRGSVFRVQEGYDPPCVLSTDALSPASVSPVICPGHLVKNRNPCPLDKVRDRRLRLRVSRIGVLEYWSDGVPEYWMDNNEGLILQEKNST